VLLEFRRELRAAHHGATARRSRALPLTYSITSRNPAGTANETMFERLPAGIETDTFC
jgi:hypothetical protein